LTSVAVRIAAPRTVQLITGLVASASVWRLTDPTAIAYGLALVWGWGLLALF